MAERTCFVFKRKRTRNGKVTASECYYGCYRLADEMKRNVIPLQTPDCQVAHAKLLRVVREIEMESEGLLPAKAVREGLNRSVAELLAEHVAEMERVRRSEACVRGFKAQIELLAKGRGWKVAKDITPNPSAPGGRGKRPRPRRLTST